MHANPDLAPTSRAQRRWGTKDIAALWISMSACIPTYMIASSLIAEGMNWWQAVLTIFLGNTIVLVPMILNAHAGTKYGIPFPIYCRASFGILGANVPALLRALVACGWFGIQTWIGGGAIYQIVAIYVPAWKELALITGLGINGAQLVCFLAFWAVNMLVIWMGIDSIRVLLEHQGPALDRAGARASGVGVPPGARLRADAGAAVAVRPGQPKAGQFWTFFFPALTAMIGFWATLSLNIPDFTRYARSQRDQILGQALGLPDDDGPLFVHWRGRHVGDGHDLRQGDLGPGRGAIQIPRSVRAFDRHGVALPGDPGDQHRRQRGRPGQRLFHVWPRRISFRTGGLITGVLGILIQPWKLIADPTGYIFHMAHRLFLTSRRGRRHLDRRLLRHPPHAARSGRTLQSSRAVLVCSWI